MSLHDANHARLVAILHAVAAKAAELLYADDAIPGLTDLERVGRLSEDLGTAAFESRTGGCGFVDDALVDLAAGVLLWLESRERERAAA